MKTDSSSLSILQTCSCSTCTCSNDKIKFDYLENNDDCLTYILITLYESSIWCMEILYEHFFKSLWQIFMYIKQELQYRQSDNKTINNMNMISINNSSRANYPLISNKRNSLIDTHIILVPVRSSHCQTEIDLQTINIDLNQSEQNINLHEQLTNRFCRRLHEPLIFMNREIYCRQNQTSIVPSSIKKIPSDLVSFHHSEQIVFQQQTSDKKMELSLYKQLPLYSANRNTSEFPVSNILNKSSSFLLPNPTDNNSFSNNTQPFFVDRQQRKLSQKKFKQKRRIIDDHNIPIALATSLHSNVSLYNEDYFLTKKYIHQLFTDKYHLR